jgi:hypothetical protein
LKTVGGFEDRTDGFRAESQEVANDYTQSTNPPVLHRKESFLSPNHPSHEKFARLTSQEEIHGLLDDPSGIGTREGWARRLSERGFSLKGHRLVRSTGLHT